MNWCVVVLMDKAPLLLSSSIRTIASDKLLRNISIVRMHNSLVGLFTDRTAIDTSFGRFFKKENITQFDVWQECLYLHDETVGINRKVDESYNMFVPFESGDAE